MPRSADEHDLVSHVADPTVGAAAHGRQALDQIGEHIALHRDVVVREGTPSYYAPEGTLYWDKTNDLLYVNSDGANGWTNIGASGAAAHDMLDGSAHQDSVADAVSRGSLIYGNATPAWDELVLGADTTFLRSDGTDAAWSAIQDGDVPSTHAGSAHHAAVTLSGTPDYITLSGQDIVRGQVDLTTDVTGDLPISEGGTGQSTAQAAIDALTQVSGATNEHVLTKDTGTGNATFKAAPSGASDLGDLTYTPADATDWDSSADPGDADDAVDQLASRTKTLEGGSGHTHASAQAYGLATVTISSGVLPLPSTPYIYCNGEGSVADTLDGIAAGADGQELTLQAAGGTITIKHNNGSAGEDILLQGAADLALPVDGNGTTTIKFRYYNTGGGFWIEQSRFVAASATYAGIAELATAAETTTGTDATRAVTPDGLQDSKYNEHSLQVTVETPAVADSIKIHEWNRAITITEVKGVCFGGTSPDVDINLYHHANRNTAVGSANKVLTSDLTITSETTSASSTTFTDATVPADAHLWLYVAQATSVPTAVEVTVYYSYD